MGVQSNGGNHLEKTFSLSHILTTKTMKVLALVAVALCVALTHSSPIQDLTEQRLALLLGKEKVGAYLCGGLGSTICGKIEKCCERLNENPGDYICCRPGQVCGHYNDPENKMPGRDCCCAAGTECGPNGECLTVA